MIFLHDVFCMSLVHEFSWSTCYLHSVYTWMTWPVFTLLFQWFFSLLFSEWLDVAVCSALWLIGQLWLIRDLCSQQCSISTNCYESLSIHLSTPVKNAFCVRLSTQCNPNSWEMRISMADCSILLNQPILQIANLLDKCCKLRIIVLYNL